MSKPVMMDLARQRPEILRTALNVLFDESKLLVDRIRDSRVLIDATYKEIVPDKSPHFDERTQATLLTFKNPNIYTFYKNYFYQKLCRLLSISTRSTGQKYEHYLELINEFVDEYILEDIELLSLVDSILTPD